jgi:small ligand-binding sensory domain FIST
LVKWSSHLATTAHLADAVDEAAEALSTDLGGSPQLVVAFVTGDYSDHFHQLPDYVRRHFPNAELVGCSAHGVIAGGREVEREPSISLTGAILPGVEIKSFHLDQDPKSWVGSIGLDPDLEPEFVLLTDPYSLPAQNVVDWFDAAYPVSTKIGGLASGAGQPGETALWAAGHTHRTGAVGVALCGNVEVDTIVAQGCRPIGSPMFVTRADGNLIIELDGQPALASLELLHTELSPDDQRLFRRALHIGVVMRDALESYEHGDFLIRNILGIDPNEQTLAVDLIPRDNQVVQFHVRDSITSAEDLSTMLSRHQYGSPAGALLFSCVGRGQELYGVANHDSQMFSEQLGPVPLGGFFSGGEIGPIHGETFVHGYTSSFGLFRPKRPT